MNEGRDQEAVAQAHVLREDIIRQGREVPLAVPATEQIALSRYHLRELHDLRRVREEKWLAVLLEVERSHIPFPDEPPVAFPTPAKIRVITNGQFDNWTDYSKYKLAKYPETGFGPEMPKRALELKRKLTEVRKFKGFDDPRTTLEEALQVLERSLDVTFDVNAAAFKYDNVVDVLKTPVADPNPIPGFRGTLATMLKKLLAKVPAPSGATFIIRRENIELTTEKFAVAEKALRVYPVGDLVLPIPTPGQFAQQSLLNTGVLGSAIGAIGQIGALGAIGQIGQIGALGAIGQIGQIGQIGALGQVGALGAIGQVGAIGALGQIGAIGQLGAVGGALGALGGALGAVGGALGALGRRARCGRRRARPVWSAGCGRRSARCTRSDRCDRRPNRTDRPNRSNRTDRPNRSNRPDRSDRPTRPDWPARSGRPNGRRPAKQLAGTCVDDLDHAGCRTGERLDAAIQSHHRPAD